MLNFLSVRCTAFATLESSRLSDIGQSGQTRFMACPGTRKTYTCHFSQTKAGMRSIYTIFFVPSNILELQDQTAPCWMVQVKF